MGKEALEEIVNDRQEARFPVSRGIVIDWDAIESIWNYIFDTELTVPSDQCDVLMAEAPLNPKKNRERTAEIMFEHFNVSGFYLASTAVLSLYAVRMTSGVVVTSGEGVTHCVPIYDGAALPHGQVRFNVSGYDLTEYVGKILDEKGCNFSNTEERYRCAREIKESLCYVAEDFAEEMAAPVRQEKYKMPDGSVLKLSKERFQCCEALFQPYLADRQAVGLHRAIYQSLNRCDSELREELYGNIMLSGGSTLFPYFEKRLLKEVSQLTTPETRVNVVAVPERKHAAWIGGSVLTEMSTFGNMIILREDYEEYGPSIVRRKC